MMFKYHLAVPHLPYGGIEAGARVPPIALNNFNSFLKRGGAAGISQGRPHARGACAPRWALALRQRPKYHSSLNSSHVGAPEAPGPFRRIRGTTPTGQLGNTMFRKHHLALHL